MCVIFHILPGKQVDSKKLYIAACNNWQGWGLTVKNTDTNKLENFRFIPENSNLPDYDPLAGGNFAEMKKIEEMLSKYEKYPRYLHFRHATKGHVIEANCHPFILRDTDNEQVVLMHNGAFHASLGTSLNAYGEAYHLGSKITNAPSDTKDFVDKFLVKPLNVFVNGDYTDPVFKEFIWDPLYREKGCGSRVILVSNKWADFKVGAWETVLDANNEVEYYVSNNQYFDKIERGPVFRQMEEAARKEKERDEAHRQIVVANENRTVAAGARAITPYAHGIFQPDPKVLSGLHAIFKSFGAGVAPGEIIDLAECSIAEFEAIIKTSISEGNVRVVAELLDMMIKNYADLYDTHENFLKKHEDLVAKHDSATKMIATLKKEEKNAGHAETKAA